jgi:tRNA G18 (ribose-2'-O)-methylase SpoU
MLKTMVVILHNIRSLHNVGSVFRTADAAGIEKIYLCGITPKPIDEFGKPRRQLTKVSLGAEKYAKWEHCKSTARLIDKLKREGYKIFAVEQNKKSIPYYKIKIRGARAHSRFRIVLILGNEINGLPQSVLKRADKILEIPMRGKKESLNVAVAFGIVSFHFIPQLKLKNFQRRGKIIKC